MMCPRCGKEVDMLYDNLCLSCRIEKIQLQEVRLRKCKICHKYFVSNRSFDDTEIAIEYYTKKFLSKKMGELIEHLPREKIKVVEREFICNECRKFASKRVEAILQLRGDCVEEIARNYNLAAKLVKGGVDVDFSIKRDAYQIINKIKKEYNLSMKITRKLVGLKNGRRIYRDTIVVRIDGKKV